MLFNRLGAISRRYRHMQRYREIAGVLLKHGFGDVVNTLGLHGHLWLPRWGRARDEEPASPARHERLRLACEELGPTFVKLGQILSTRRDVFSDATATELEKLQDTVSPFPGAEARRIVEEQLGRPVAAVFRVFSETPLASASIAQVHEAVTLAGERVVVKVRRPGIEAVIETDLEILAHLAVLVEKTVDGAAVFDPAGIVREFSRVMRRELDFTAEASHMARFARCFADDRRIHVPTVCRELTTDRVLTMEFIDGVKVTPVAELADLGLDREVIATRGVELMFEQVFMHGFYHADPHPGNIRILPGNVICLLDYGMMGMLSARYREHLSDLIVGLVTRDERRIAAAVFHISGDTQFEKAESVESDVAKFVGDHLDRPLGDIRVGDVLNQLTRLAVMHGIRMPPDFFVLSKALATMEGVGRRLSPDFDVIRHAEPFARRLLRERVSVRRMAGEFAFSMLELQSLLRDLPSEAREILNMLKRGEARVKFEHHGLEGLISTLDQVTNRLVFGIVLAALLVGSSIMVRSAVPPMWCGMPVIGVAGFVISGLMGFSLLYSILRHGRM